jgi:hypothetical protein
MGKEGYCLLYKHLQQHLHKAFLKRVHMASIQKLIACRAALPKRLPADKGRRKHQEKIQGKMKNTPLLSVIITAPFASFPSACESRNNNRKN